MAKNERLFKLKQHVVENVQVTSSYSPETIIDLTTGQTDDSTVLSISIETDNTAILNVALYRRIGTVDTFLGVYPIQANQGRATNLPPLELVANGAIPSAIKTDDKYQLPLPAGQKIRFSLSAAPASGKVVNLIIVRGDF